MTRSHIMPSTIGILALMLAIGVSSGHGGTVVDVDRHLVQYENGVVYDRDAALEWYAGPNRSMTWAESKQWVASLNVDGGGWRMPTRRELKTLHHVGDGINNMTRLLYTSGYWLWAGQSEAEARKWVFSFSFGGEGWIGIAPPDGGRAMAVRLKTRYTF